MNLGRRSVFVAVGAAAAVLLFTVSGFVLLVGDQEPACETVSELETYDAKKAPGRIEALTDQVVLQLKAVQQAKKSDDASLQKAARTKSLGSEFSPNSPLYENPADVQYNAVLQWCKESG
jgi:hypothetical protein